MTAERGRMATIDPSGAPQPGPCPPDPGGVATLLRQAREQRGLTLEQVARETKVQVHRLAALERHGPADSKGGFYQRARVRAYARAVGLDERVVLAELDREAPPTAPPPVSPPPLAGIRSSRGQHIVTLVACAVILAGLSRTVWDASARDTDNYTAPIAPSSQPERRAAPRVESSAAAAQSVPRVAPATPPLTDSTPLVAEPSPPAVDDVQAPEAEARTPFTATPASTALVVITEPREARVAVNGIGWGSTPITIQHLSPGDKRIRVTKDGYQAVERVIRVAEDQSTTVNIQLEPAP
jgi:cytoskeleton protein RodZ